MRKHLPFVAACYYSGLVKLVRSWRRRSGQHLIILNYHSASEGDLRRHLLYLRRHYRILPLEEALEELYAPRRQGKPSQKQLTPLVLTFDDGYRDNYTHAFALACELQIPMTIFLIPGYIGSGRRFWWMEGDHLVQHAQVSDVAIEGRHYDLRCQEERKDLAQAIYTRAIDATSVAEREAFLAMAREALDVPSAITVDEECVLTWAQICQMEESGWVSFGAHTMHHPVLGYLADPAEVQREVVECRTVIEQHLGHHIRTFAYPVGETKHIGKEAPHVVQKAGYDWALTTIYGVNTPQTDAQQIRRVVVDVGWHWLLLAAAVSGVWQFFFPLLNYGVTLLSTGKRLVTSLATVLKVGNSRLRSET
jgi:peptidoglycan/xylan/chitin deacetylase (PgdA/CDA1 family)